MKLNKLTSAVSVSLLAVALTACGGSDDDAPIINNNASTTPAPAPTPTPAPTPAVVDNAANIAALTAAFKAAGLSDAKAAELAAANPTITAGGAEFNALVTAAKAPADTGTNTAVSETVVKANPHINGVDTTKFATVTANQYTRQPGSNYDRRANPAEGLAGGLGAIGTDDPTKANPYLSNYVLGVEVVDGKVVAIDSTGELAISTGSGKAGRPIEGNRSPYIENDGLQYVAATTAEGTKPFSYAIAARAAIPNVIVPGGGAAPTAAAATGANGDAYDIKVANVATANNTTRGLFGNSGSSIASTTAGTVAAPTIYTIQQVNNANTFVGSARVTQALAAATAVNPTALTRDSNGQTQSGGAAFAGQGAGSGLIVYNSSSIAVGNAEGARLGYKVPAYGVEENIYDADGIALNSVNAFQDAQAGNNNANRNISTFLAKEAVQYTGNNSNSTADVSLNGRETFYVEKYKAADDVVNATAGGVTSGATTAGAANVLTTVGTIAGENHLANAVANNLETRIFGKNYNAYEAGRTGQQDNVNTYVARYDSKNQLSNLGVNTLHNVQYGRLTNNIDVLDNKTAESRPIKAYRQFQQHGADNTVDTYFYRGTNHTTLKQMEDVVAKGGTIQYYGHALTYGVGPVVEETKAGTVPTAYGIGSSVATIGNFVQAKYDVAKGKVDGSVYNFINNNVTARTTNKDFKRQDLITFGGDVYGNTVTGTATKLGVNEQGTFTGSFFGSGANELGGSISSITRSEGYSSPKWGAVFGATRGSSVENFNVIEQGN